MSEQRRVMRRSFWANIFIVSLFVGPIFGSLLSYIYEAVVRQGYPLFSPDFFGYFPQWLDDHSFIVIFGSIFVISGLIFGVRYAAGMRLVAIELGPWGSVTSIFFTTLSMFLMSRLSDQDLKEMFFNPTDSFVLGTILFGVATGGVLWFLIRTTMVEPSPGQRRDPVFMVVFAFFFITLIVVGFITGFFAAASVEFANNIQPIYDPEGADPMIALLTFFFSPIAGLYAIGFFIPMTVFPIFLMVFADVRGTGTVEGAIDRSKNSPFFLSGEPPKIGQEKMKRKKKGARIPISKRKKRKGCK